LILEFLYVQVTRQSQSNSLTVTLKILSNWGHPSRVGLTEVQFFDQTKNRFDVNPDDIRVKGARNVKGDLAVLCNGKCKVRLYEFLISLFNNLHLLHFTSILDLSVCNLSIIYQTIKERNMWTCSKPESHHPVCLIFNLKQCDMAPEEFGLGLVRIWNYNKCLSVSIRYTNNWR